MRIHTWTLTLYIRFAAHAHYFEVMASNPTEGSASPPESKRPRTDDSDSSSAGENERSTNGMGSRTRVVLALCGSFSPITYLHLRMFGACRFSYCPSFSRRYLTARLLSSGSPPPPPPPSPSVRLASHALQRWHVTSYRVRASTRSWGAFSRPFTTPTRRRCARRCCSACIQHCSLYGAACLLIMNNVSSFLVCECCFTTFSACMSVTRRDLWKVDIA